MENLFTEIANLHPQIGTAIVAMVTFLLANSFLQNTKLNEHIKNVAFAIAVMIGALVGLLFTRYVDGIGVQLISALAGVAIAPLIMNWLTKTNGGSNDIQ